jgi:hypothetical protein
LGLVRKKADVCPRLLLRNNQAQHLDHGS